MAVAIGIFEIGSANHRHENVVAAIKKKKKKQKKNANFAQKRRLVGARGCTRYQAGA